MDPNTSYATRGKFARVCVEIDLNKPLVPKIYVGGNWQTIEYEGLNLICFKCGHVDHKGLCPYQDVDVQVPNEVQVEGHENGEQKVDGEVNKEMVDYA